MKDRITLDIERCLKLTKYDLIIENVARKFNRSPITIQRYFKASHSFSNGRSES